MCRANSYSPTVHQQMYHKGQSWQHIILGAVIVMTINYYDNETEREREREREREMQTDRQTDRHTDRQTGSQRQRQTETERERKKTNKDTLKMYKLPKTVNAIVKTENKVKINLVLIK